MKRLLLSFLILLLYFETAHCQYIKPIVDNQKQELSNFIALEQNAKTNITTTDSEAFEMYNFFTIQKNKKQKTGWILLGSGVTLMAAAIIWGSSDDSDSFGFSDNFDTQAILFLTGGVMSIASIPFFISSGNNKRNAMLTLNKVTTNFKSIAVKKSNYLSIGLTVHL